MLLIRSTVARFSCVAILSLASGSTAQELIFKDGFDDELAPGWRWIREQPAQWCVRDGALDIRVVPGNGRTVRNALVRRAPDRRQGSFAIDVTVSNRKSPIEIHRFNRYESLTESGCLKRSS